MKTCSSISPEKRQGNCDVTVYVPARDRRNCFDPSNYLLIKSKPDANYPTYAVTQRGWEDIGTAKLQSPARTFEVSCAPGFFDIRKA
jgi:hypothetical protein